FRVRHLTVKAEADIYLQLDDAKVLTAVDTKTDGKSWSNRAGTWQANLNFRKEIAKLREKMQAIAPKNDAHFVNQEDEVNINDPVSVLLPLLSWMVQDKAPSHLDAAVQCVVRKKAKIPRKIPAGILKNMKEEKNVVPQLRDSAETWSSSEDKNKYGKLDATLDHLVASFLDGPLKTRKPQLTKTQVYPNVGKSTVKRIITTYYDPSDKVSETKWKKLLDFPRTHADDEDLTTPRKDWETDESRWLTDSHMTSAMLMFHKRSMKDPSPYSSSRITFLEHLFVKMWVRDYKKYDPKTWEFSDTYKKVFNGNYPPEFSDNKKWLMDVDRLYLCHLINVVPSNTYLLEECRPFPKMIPLFLNEMVQEKLRKKNSQQFKISRLKSVPKNEDPGDGGAIGYGFEGLYDKCISTMRINLAAEIYDEVSGL
ncbi:hypothetical protein HID58_057835, partial [Brassica napus]